jgi:hypothetical protein
MTALYPVNTISGILTQVKTLLTAELGTFKNGKPAIWVEPPASPEVGTGLHVYLCRYEQRLTQEIYQWQVVLRQRDTSEAGLVKLDAAIKKMRSRFYNRREVILPYSEDRYPQANFYLPYSQSAYRGN